MVKIGLCERAVGNIRNGLHAELQFVDGGDGVGGDAVVVEQEGCVFVTGDDGVSECLHREHVLCDEAHIVEALGWCLTEREYHCVADGLERGDHTQRRR